MKRAVFLDRDGVINRSRIVNGVPSPPKNVSEIELLDGVVEAIKILKEHNFLPVVITNQPDVARGATTEFQVKLINDFIGDALRIDYFYTCMHDDQDFCPCRKPAPGLIQRAADELGLDISKSYLVGDRWRDIAAGQSAGCQTFFIDYSYGEKGPSMPFIPVSSLFEAAQIMIGAHHGAK
jgi:D-glycero-D-manno-heptose 1,7-bisphosphate phosphatase